MKKYRLELSIGIVFLGLVVAMMWTKLADVNKFVPYALCAAFAIALGAVVTPWGSKQEEESSSEKYAPKYFAQTILWSVVGIAIIVFCAAILGRDRFSKTFDLTERKVNSLSEETEKFLTSLEKPVQIYCVPSNNPAERYCEESQHLRSLYAESSKNVSQTVLSLGNAALLQTVRPSGFARLILISEDKRGEVVGKVSESKLTNAIINMIKSKKTVYFLVGNGEPGLSADGGERSYSNIAQIMKDKAYEVKEHNVSSGDIPADAKMLVAGSATVPYGANVENMLRRFLSRGGHMVLTMNPYRSPGMAKLFSDLGINLQNNLLVGNKGATQFGAQLMQLDALRPPVVLGEFSRESASTSVFSPRDMGIVEAAREMGFATNSDNAGSLVKLKHTKLMSAFNAAPVSLTEEQRNKIALQGALNVNFPAEYDVNKTYNVGVQVEIEKASKLAEGIPAATVAMNGNGTGIGGADATENKTPTADAKKEESKDTAEVIVLGFEVANKFEQVAPANIQILPMAVAHLYRDKDVLSIPTKDFAPKSFNMSRNPSSFLFLFAGFLPISTLLAGVYIWMRRRSA
jgi:ABC-type uncharacterized transport system